MEKICVVSANLGGFDKEKNHVEQSIEHDKIVFTDTNFPPRLRAMTPRLQAKIPKCFAWQLAPGYDYYLWMDSNISLAHKDSLKYFYDNCKDYDIVVLKHPKRNTVKWEGRYMERAMNEQSKYMVTRYENELLKEQMDVIKSDKEFVDDLLVIGGIFMYKNKPEVQNMLKEWWYHISRYLIMDQCSFSYLLKKSNLNINVRQDVYNNCEYINLTGHTSREK